MAPAVKPKGGALTRKAGPLPVWGWGAILLGIVGLYLWRQHSASAASSIADVPAVSGSTAAADGSDAQTPSGGGGSSASNLPDSLVDQPDPLTTQVQQSDTTNPESPQAISGNGGGNGSTYIGYGAPGQAAQPPAYVAPPPVAAPPPFYNPPPVTAPGGTFLGGAFLK